MKATTFAEDGITAHPLSWPAGWKRTKYPGFARFGKHSFARARDAILHELYLMDALSRNAILSTNLSLRNDGLPYSNQAQPHDAGVAVYFHMSKEPRVLACDRWNRIEHNAWAIAKHIETLRAQNRWGVGSIEQAFMGYTALPASTGRNWWEVLGVFRERATMETVNSAFRIRARECHPDAGGSHDAMTELNGARDQAMKELGELL